MAGLSRTFIEFFRPDQPRIGDSFVSYTMLVSFLMAVAGLVMLLARYGKLQLAWAENWEEEYQVKKLILISNDPFPRQIDNILILPWNVFLEKLWAGELIN